MARVSNVSALGAFYQLFESLKPKFLGRAIVHNIFQIQIRPIKLIPSVLMAIKARASLPFIGVIGLGFLNNKKFIMGETPSASACGSDWGLQE